MQAAWICRSIQFLHTAKENVLLGLKSIWKNCSFRDQKHIWSIWNRGLSQTRIFYSYIGARALLQNQLCATRHTWHKNCLYVMINPWYQQTKIKNFTTPNISRRGNDYGVIAEVTRVKILMPPLVHNQHYMSSRISKEANLTTLVPWKGAGYGDHAYLTEQI